MFNFMLRRQKYTLEYPRLRDFFFVYYHQYGEENTLLTKMTDEWRGQFYASTKLTNNQPLVGKPVVLLNDRVLSCMWRTEHYVSSLSDTFEKVFYTVFDNVDCASYLRFENYLIVFCHINVIHEFGYRKDESDAEKQARIRLYRWVSHVSASAGRGFETTHKQTFIYSYIHTETKSLVAPFDMKDIADKYHRSSTSRVSITHCKFDMPSYKKFAKSEVVTFGDFTRGDSFKSKMSLLPVSHANRSCQVHQPKVALEIPFTEAQKYLFGDSEMNLDYYNDFRLIRDKLSKYGEADLIASYEKVVNDALFILVVNTHFTAIDSMLNDEMDIVGYNMRFLTDDILHVVIETATYLTHPAVEPDFRDRLKDYLVNKEPRLVSLLKFDNYIHSNGVSHWRKDVS
jgi:hypothetical protein